MENEPDIQSDEMKDQPGVSSNLSSDAAPGSPSNSAEHSSQMDDAPQITVILASGSPRRKELLEQAGVQFMVRIPNVEETLDEDLAADPQRAAQALAERKAGAIVQQLLAENPVGMFLVLGADTVVVCDDEMFGKPRNLSDAKRMLRRLSNNTHQVITAVSGWLIVAPEEEDLSMGYRTFADTSAVTFYPLTDEEIDDYLRKGESFDKAGAYAAQGAGADLIKNIEGSVDTVIGLPVKRLLEEFGELIPRETTPSDEP